MSASLVGSEMCIRDSVSVNGGAHAAHSKDRRRNATTTAERSRHHKKGSQTQTLLRYRTSDRGPLGERRQRDKEARKRRIEREGKTGERELSLIHISEPTRLALI
eukprot:5593993-Alexandrium_andersonii.AAC.1